MYTKHCVISCIIDDCTPEPLCFPPVKGSTVPAGLGFACKDYTTSGLYRKIYCINWSQAADFNDSPRKSLVACPVLKSCNTTGDAIWGLTGLGSHFLAKFFCMLLQVACPSCTISHSSQVWIVHNGAKCKPLKPNLSESFANRWYATSRGKNINWQKTIMRGEGYASVI